MADNQGDEGTGQGLAERARQNAEANAYVTQRDHPATPTEPKSNPYASTPQDKVTNQHPAPKGEKATYKEASEILKKHLPTYDKGGKVNVNDGKHQVAILKDGERVLTEKQNKEYEKEHGMDCYDAGGTVEHSPAEKAHFHRAMSHLHGGALHRHLGIPEGQPIPMTKKQAAANSDNPHVAAMGRMAVAMHGWKHPGKK
jgi:hypothetical protein